MGPADTTVSKWGSRLLGNSRNNLKHRSKTFQNEKQDKDFLLTPNSCLSLVEDSSRKAFNPQHWQPALLFRRVGREHLGGHKGPAGEKLWGQHLEFGAAITEMLSAKRIWKDSNGIYY